MSKIVFAHRMICLGIAASSFSFPGLVLAAATPKPKPIIKPPALGSPALRLVQSYQLGISDYAPAAAVERLDSVIKTSHLAVQEMLAEAKQTRADEQAGCRAALAQLKLMGAPLPVISPYAASIAALSAPVPITDRAKSQLPDDPLGQQVWSTLDEAERIAPSSGGTLIPWLKLARGRDAVWAYHLGNLSAVIRASIPGDSNLLPLIHGSGALAESAPPGCPKALIDALKATAERANENNVTPASLAALDAVIQSVFDPTRQQALSANSQAASNP